MAEHGLSHKRLAIGHLPQSTRMKNGESNNMNVGQLKQMAAKAAVEHVQDGMIVGLGTGSTASPAIQLIGERGLKIRGVPTSEASAELARSLGIPLLTLADVTRIDLTIDGADEIDPQGNLIKGGGGALLREKVVASITCHQIIIADKSKDVPVLGRFPLPIEVVPFATPLIRHQIRELGCVPVLRQRDGKTFVTDNGNYILDCAFGKIEAPAALDAALQRLPGIVEDGLFVGLTHRIIVASEDGVCDRVVQGEDS